VRPDLVQVADVADVIARPILVHVLPTHRITDDRTDTRERLHNGAGVLTATPEIVDLCAPLSRDEGRDEAATSNA
jgi:hypothetical protein